nr:helix-turn-helix transcriptional regulator [Kribbella sandramycini]
MRLLAAELQELRSAARLTREQVEEQAGVNQGTLWRIEKAQAKPHNGTLEALFELYGVPAERRTELLELAQAAKTPGWSHTGPQQVHDAGYAAYVAFESQAKAMHNYESIYVPGLLQTEEYARASMVDGPPMERAVIDARVRIRTERQAVLSRQGDGVEPLQFWAVMDEALLHREVGDRSVLRRQLQKLIDEADRPNVTLQVIPFSKGAYPWMNGGFVRFVFGSAAPDLIYEERLGGSVFMEREEEVDRYGFVFDQLRARALSPRDTIAFIAKLMTS